MKNRSVYERDLQLHLYSTSKSYRRKKTKNNRKNSMTTQMGIMTTIHENFGNSEPIRSDVPIPKRLSLLNIISTMLMIIASPAVITNSNVLHDSVTITMIDTQAISTTKSGKKTKKKLTL